MSFSDELDIDPENFTGRQTPLYFAAKQKQVENVKLLIANGASIKNVCYGKTVEDLIKENLPKLDVVKYIKVTKLQENFMTQVPN